MQELLALNHDLPVSLVTLSACSTSLGKGEDLIGLSSAFLYAGTPSVLATLWNVDDWSTSELMVDFYRELSSKDRAEALREGQLKMLSSSEHAHPYFWAAFRLMGSPLKIDLERQHSTSAFNFMHRWSFQDQEGYLIAPVLAEGKVFVTWKERDKRQEKSEMSRRYEIWALSLNDRELLWKHELSNWARCHHFIPGFLHVNTPNAVYALRTTTGEIVWEQPSGSQLSQSLKWDGSHLYMGGRSRTVYALNPSTGAIIWEHQLPRSGSGGFAVGEKRILIGCNDHHLYCLHAASGIMCWKQDLGYAEWKEEEDWIFAGQLYTKHGTFSLKHGDYHETNGEHLSIVVEDQLQLENLRSLPQKVMVKLENLCIYHDENIILISNKINNNSNNAHISLYDIQDGKLLRRIRLGREIVTGISREGNTFLVGSDDGMIHAFSIEKSQRGECS